MTMSGATRCTPAAISFDDVIIPEDAVNDGPKEVVFAKKDEK